jgi:hypothetical protein
MKKLLVVLLSLGLIVAFSMTASAADMKVGGSYALTGVYWNNPAVRSDGAYSRAFFYQKVQFTPVFAIAEGLTFTARMDALEKQWGQTDWANSYSDTNSSRRQTITGANNPKIQENIEFERAYVTFKTAIGALQVGYQSSGAWGTAFNDDETTRPRILYSLPMGPATLIAAYDMYYEPDTSVIAGQAGLVDAGYDQYTLGGIYKFKAGEAGMAGVYTNDASRRKDLGYRTKTTLLMPYAKMTFGPVYVETELAWHTGSAKKFDNAGTDVSISAWAAYVMAKLKLGPANVGGQFAYSTGDDGSDATKIKTSAGASGRGWSSPTLILMRDYMGYGYPAGSPARPTNVSNKQNMTLYNVFGDFAPTPKLSMTASLTYATVNEKLTVDSNQLGTEVDMTATYKIYDQLTYMVGAGYLFTGNYFKGAPPTKEIGNDYLLINKLTLTF